MLKAKLRSFSSTVFFTSIVSLLLIITLTDPSENILYSLIFFLLAFILLLNLGFFLTNLVGSNLRNRGRRKVIILSSLIIITLMFSSLGALNWASAFTLALIALGLVFYWDKRAG